MAAYFTVPTSFGLHLCQVATLMARRPLAPATMFEGALHEASDGVLIDVDVRPGADSTRITGYNEWRRSVTVDVAAPPQRGEANREVESLFTRLAGHGCVARIVRGHSSRRKTVLVEGAEKPALLAALNREPP